MSTYNKGAQDAQSGKGPASTQNMPWQAANSYNAGYSQNK